MDERQDKADQKLKRWVDVNEKPEKRREEEKRPRRQKEIL